MTASEPDRMRTPPRERFTGDTKPFDLQRIFQQLADEPHEAIGGHRQIALFKSDSTTVVAFLFEEGGVLPEHRADGVATLQVLEGRLDVTTPDTHHALGAGGLLTIKPNIAHEVRAHQPSKMILTVNLVDR